MQPLQSPWCNAVVLVKKQDSYPLPQMQEIMESMVSARFFSTMDLKSGFWQVKMSEKSSQYTKSLI